MRSTLMLLLMLSLGCANVRVARSEKTAGGGSPKTIRLNSFIFGFVPTPLPSEAEVCPGAKIETVDLHQNVNDVLLSTVTLGIYVPHRAEITCTP